MGVEVLAFAPDGVGQQHFRGQPRNGDSGFFKECGSLKQRGP